MLRPKLSGVEAALFYLAVEFGFRKCELGYNLQAALNAASQFITEDVDASKGSDGKPEKLQEGNQRPDPQS